MKIKNVSKNTIIANDCRVADNPVTRFMGLMGKKSLPEASGLILTPCNSIHMCFMKFPLDVILIDKHNTVVCLIENIRPWRISKIVPKAHSAIELPVGSIKKSSSALGDKLILSGMD